jgi:hypothetical protein
VATGTSTSNWLNDFIAQQQQTNAARDQMVNANSAIAQQMYAAKTRPTIGGIDGNGTTVGDYLLGPHTNFNIPKQDVSGGPSIISRALDLIERPLYAVSNLATSLVQEAKGEIPKEGLVESVAKGLGGQDKGTYIDTAKALGLPNGLASALGTAGNIFLDPANIALGPLGGLAVKGTKAAFAAAHGGITAAKAAEEAAKFRDAAEVVGNKPDLSFSANPEEVPIPDNTAPPPPSAPPPAAAPAVPTPTGPIPPTPTPAAVVPQSMPAADFPAAPVPDVVKTRQAVAAGITPSNIGPQLPPSLKAALADPKLNFNQLESILESHGALGPGWNNYRVAVVNGENKVVIPIKGFDYVDGEPIPTAGLGNQAPLPPSLPKTTPVGQALGEGLANGTIAPKAPSPAGAIPVNSEADALVAVSKAPKYADSPEVTASRDRLQDYINQGATKFEINREFKALQKAMDEHISTPPGSADSLTLSNFNPVIPEEPVAAPVTTSTANYDFASERDRLKGVPSVKEAEKRLAAVQGSTNFDQRAVDNAQKNLENKVQAASLRYPKDEAEPTVTPTPQPVNTAYKEGPSGGPKDLAALDARIAKAQADLEEAYKNPNWQEDTGDNPEMAHIVVKRPGQPEKIIDTLPMSEAVEYYQNLPMSAAKNTTLVSVDTPRAAASARVKQVQNNLRVLREQRDAIAPAEPLPDTAESRAAAQPPKPARPDPLAGRESPFKEGDTVTIKYKAPDRKYRQTFTGKLNQDPATGVIQLVINEHTSIPVRLMPDGKMFGGVELVSYTPKGADKPIAVPGISTPAATPKATTPKTTKPKTVADKVAEPPTPMLMPGDQVTIQRAKYGHSNELHPPESGTLFVDQKSGKLVFKTGENNAAGKPIAVEVKQDPATGKLFGKMQLISHTPAPKELTSELPPELPAPTPAPAPETPIAKDILKDLPHQESGPIPVPEPAPEPAPVVTPEPVVIPDPTPAPEEVRAAANNIPDNPEEAVPHAQQAEKVIKSKTPPNITTMQGNQLDKLAAAHLYNASKEAIDPARKFGDAALNLQTDIVKADRAFHDTGNNYEVQASKTSRQLNMDETKKWDLGASDVMSVLGPDGVRDAVINPATRLAGQQLLRMGAAALTGREAGLVGADLAKYVQRIGQSWAPSTAWAHNSYAGIRNAVAHAKTLQTTAGFIAKNVDRLRGRVADNVVRAREAVAQAAGLVTHDVETGIGKAITSEGGGTQAAAVDALSNVGKLVSDSAGHNPKVVAAAGPVVGEDVAKVVSTEDINAAKTTKQHSDTWTDPSKTPTQQRTQVIGNTLTQVKQITKDADADLLPVVPPDTPLTDLEDLKTANALERIVSRLQHPIRTLLGKFAPNGHDVAVMQVQGESRAIGESTQVKNALGKLRNKYDKETIDTAYMHLQNDTWPTDTKTLAAAQELLPALEMAGVDMSAMYDGVGAPLKGGMYAQGFSLGDIKRAQEDQGLPHSFTSPKKSELDALKAANPEKTERALMGESWKRHTPDDVIDFIGRLHGAHMVLSTNYGVGFQFGEKFGSLTRLPGYVKLASELPVPGGSRFWQAIPRVDAQGRDIYYPAEAAKWMAHTEHAVAGATGFARNSGPVQKFLANHLDPLIATWKTSVTVAKPSYIVRNFVGDTMLNTLVGVNGVKAYKDAFQVLKAGGRLSDRTIEAIKTNLTVPSDATAVGSWKANVALKNGKTQVLNDQGMYNLASQHGVTLSYALSADVIQAKAGAEGASAAQKIYDKVSANRAVQAASRWNEEASHIPRLAQFTHHMQDPNFTSKYHTLDEAAQAAAQSVRQLHPDMTGLSASGRNVMRRVMPFYSWTRLVTPIILETLLTKPNRLTALPKAYYGINKATGGNPPSITEGIDPTRLVPDFVRNQLGYVGGNSTFDLGSPVESLEQTFPGRNTQDVMRGGIYNMLSPLIKAPIDLISGVDQSSGKGIPAKQEYIDQDVPFFGDISQITGYSPTGSLARIITGQGVVDPTRATQSGEKQAFINQGTINFLTGLHLANFNRGSYANIAQKQYRAGTL